MGGKRLFVGWGGSGRNKMCVGGVSESGAFTLHQFTAYFLQSLTSWFTPWVSENYQRTDSFVVVADDDDVQMTVSS